MGARLFRTARKLPPSRNRRETRGVLFSAAALLAAGALIIDRIPASGRGNAGAAGTLPSGGWALYFSPDGGATEAIVTALDKATATVRVQAYSFTSVPIAKALVNAKRRGVDVQVLLDGSHREGDRYSSADFLAHAGIPVRLDEAHAIAHSKVMIIDDEVVITGSFNFTKAAETKNAENLLILRASDLARRYADEWKRHHRHSEPYSAPTR